MERFIEQPWPCIKTISSRHKLWVFCVLINTYLWMATIDWLVSQSRKPSSLIDLTYAHTYMPMKSSHFDACSCFVLIFFIFYFLFKCIDAARDVWDTELTARAGESYNRAYGVWHLSTVLLVLLTYDWSVYIIVTWPCFLSHIFKCWWLNGCH